MCEACEIYKNFPEYEMDMRITMAHEPLRVGQWILWRIIDDYNTLIQRMCYFLSSYAVYWSYMTYRKYISWESVICRPRTNYWICIIVANTSFPQDSLYLRTYPTLGSGMI
jgi:hypothetical protein